MGGKTEQTMTQIKKTDGIAGNDGDGDDYHDYDRRRR